MATLVRIDDLYINLDTVTRIEVQPEAEQVTIYFSGNLGASEYGPPMTDQVTLCGEEGARLLRWLNAGGRVSEA